MIHILEKQTDNIVAVLDSEELQEAAHKRDNELQETFDFTIPVTHPKAEYIVVRNRVVIPDEDGTYREFIIDEIAKEDEDLTAFCSSSFIDLKKQEPIKAQTLTGQTVRTATDFVLKGTEWEKGNTDLESIRKISFPYCSPYEGLKTVASTFKRELNPRIEIDGNKITRRVVDQIERIGQFRGKEIEFKKDLVGLKRNEKTEDLVTALFCLGPEKEDGTRLTALVEDKDARQRWGRKGQHLVEIYEPQSSNQDMTLDELEALGTTELKKRINSSVEYEITNADLEYIPGFEHEKVRFGDTLRIKDLHYLPPLYVEARVFSIERDLIDKTKKTYKLGDFKEYAQRDVLAEFDDFKKNLRIRIVRQPTPPEGGYNVIWIDTSKTVQVLYTWDGVQWNKTTPTQASEVGAETPEGAQEKADGSRDQAMEYTNTQVEAVNEVVEQVQQDVLTRERKIYKQPEPPENVPYGTLWVDTDDSLQSMYMWMGTEWRSLGPTNAAEIGAVAKAEYEQRVSQILADLQSKVPKNTYDQTVNQILSELQNKVGNADYQTQIQAITDDLEAKVPQVTYDEKVSQITTELQNKVGNADYQAKIKIITDGLETKVPQDTYDSKMAQIQQSIGTKADLQYVNGQLVTKANAGSVYTKTEIDNALNSKVSTTIYNSDKDGIVTRLTNSENRITQNENEISLKAAKTDLNAVEGRVTDTESELSIQAGQIAAKVAKEDFDVLKSRVSSTETRITQTESNIKLKADQTVVNQKANQSDLNTTNSNVSALTTRITNAEAEIDVNANQIALKAAQSDLDKVSGRLSTAESQLTVQAGQIATKVAKKDLDALSFGYRNYIFNGDFKKGTANWSGFQNVANLSVVDDAKFGKVLEVTTDNLNYLRSPAVKSNFVDMTPGETYTISMWMKRAQEGVISQLLKFRDANNAESNPVVGNEISIPANEWFYYTETFTVPSTAVSAYLTPRIKTSIANLKFWLANVKLEKGSRATDFSRAPEDLDGDISSLNTRVANAESSITQQAGLIETKVSSSTYSTDKSAMQADINSRAKQSDLNTTNNNLAAAITRVTNAETRITQTEKEIKLKAAQTDLDTVAGRVSDAESQLSVQSGQIEARVTNTTYQTDKSTLQNDINSRAKQSDLSALSTRVSSAETRITQTENNIKLKADQTIVNQKANQSDLNNTNSNVSALTTRITNAEAEIDVNANQIALKAAKTDLDKVSGRLSTAESQLTVQAGQIATKVAQSDFNVLNDKVSLNTDSTNYNPNPSFEGKKNTYYTHAVAFVATDAGVPANAPKNYVGRQNGRDNYITDYFSVKEGEQFIVEGWIASTDSDQNFGLGLHTMNESGSNSWLARNHKSKGSGAWQYFKEQYTIQAGFTKARFFSQIAATSNFGNWFFTDVRVTKVVEQSQVNGLEERFANAESSITQQAGLIETKVSNSSYAVDKSALQNDINSRAKQIDLNTTNSNLTAAVTRVSNAETRITQTEKDIKLKAAKTDLDTVKGRVSTAESQLSVQSGQIALKASQSDLNSLAGRVTNAESSLTVANNQIATKVSQVDFENMSTGVQNLLRNTDFKNGFDFWATAGVGATRTIIDEPTAVSCKAVKMDFGSNTGSGGSHNSSAGSLVIGETYTFSVYAKADAVGAATFGNERGGTFTAQLTTDYKKFTKTFVATSASYYSTIFYRVAGAAYKQIYFHSPMLVKGNKAADWSPSNADLDASINAITSRLSTAETSIIQTKSEIALKASQTDLNALTGRVSNAESSLSVANNQIATKVSQADFNSAVQNLQNRVSTTESSIKQQAGLIATKVAQTDFDNLNIGATNILRGSMLELSDRGIWGAAALTNETADGYNVINAKRTSTSGSAGFSTLKRNTAVRASKQYTLSFEVKTARTANLDYCYMMYVGSDASNQQLPAIPIPAGANNDYIPVSVTFTTNSSIGVRNDGYVLIGTTSGALNEEIRVRKLQLEEGNRATSWKPNADELQSRLSTAESNITQQANQIQLRVTQTTFENQMNNSLIDRGSIDMTDWNNLTKMGVYRVYKLATMPNNFPSGAYEYGTLTVQTSGNSVTQTYSTHGSARQVYTRTKWNANDWNAWKQVEDVEGSQSKVNALKTGEINPLKTRMSTAESNITQQENQIQQRVTKTEFESLSIGARNLALGTATPKTATGTGGTNQTANLYSINFNEVAGKEVTVSFDIVFSANSGTAVLQWNNTPWGTLTDRVNASTTKKHYSFTKTQPLSGSATGVQLRVDNLSGTATVSNLKIELGNKETGWMQAPEDTIGDINSISNRVSVTESSITQQASLISLKVDKNGIISQINQSPEQIKIIASKLNLQGLVTITELGQDGSVIIHGGNIKAATLLADAISGGTLTLGGSTKNGVMQLLNSNDEQVAYFDADNGGFSQLYVGDFDSPTVVEYGTDDINLYVSDRKLDYTGSIEPNDDNTGTGWTKPLSTITEAIRRIPRYYDGKATINVAYSSVLYEDVLLSGFIGNGTITISFGSAKLNGNFSIQNNLCSIFTTGGTINGKSNSYAVVNMIKNSYVKLDGVKTYGNGSDHNFNTEQGYTEITNCESWGAKFGISSRYGGTTWIYNCKGYGSTAGIFAYAGRIVGYGNAPDGASQIARNHGGVVDATFTPTGGTAPTPDTQPTVLTIQANSGDSWRDNFGGQWYGQGEVVQGKYGSYGIYRGLWFFSIPSLAGKTITQIRMYVKRKNAGGYASSVTTYFKPHTYTTKPSGAPSYQSPTTTAGFKLNEGKWITIPSSFYAGFVSGSYKGIGIYINSTNNAYYAKFFADAKLEITYK